MSIDQQVKVMYGAIAPNSQRQGEGNRTVCDATPMEAEPDLPGDVEQSDQRLAGAGDLELVMTPQRHSKSAAPQAERRG